MMYRIGFLVLFLSFSLFGEVIKLGEGLTIDLGNMKQVLGPCKGEDVPGVTCILGCYKVDNSMINIQYMCNLEAQAEFWEMILTPEGPFHSGNKMLASDFRTFWVFPYQSIDICFNYGKQTQPVPDQPELHWVYQKSIILNHTPGNAHKLCEGVQTDPIPPTGSTNRPYQYEK